MNQLYSLSQGTQLWGIHTRIPSKPNRYMIRSGNWLFGIRIVSSKTIKWKQCIIYLNVGNIQNMSIWRSSMIRNLIPERPLGKLWRRRGISWLTQRREDLGEQQLGICLATLSMCLIRMIDRRNLNEERGFCTKVNSSQGPQGSWALATDTDHSQQITNYLMVQAM